MTPDELEFSISQYVDGTLSAEEAAALQDALTTDESARKLLAGYQRLNAHLSGALPLPNVDWDRLAEHLSDVVRDVDQPGVAGRIRPVRWSMPARLSIAASVLLALTVGLMFHRGTRSTETPVAPSIAIVSGPVAEAPAGAASVEIKIGPSRALAARESSWRYGEGVVTRPSHVELAGEIRDPAGEASHIR